MDSLLNNAPCGFVSFDDSSHILSVNETFCNYLGYSCDDVRGKKFEFVLTISGKIFFQTHFFPLLKLHNRAEEIFLSLHSKKGDLVPVIVNAESKIENGQNIYHVIFIPVHNRRKYEDEILAAKKIAEQTLKENKVLAEAQRQIEEHAIELDKQVTRLKHLNNELMQFNNIINHDMQECIRKIVLFGNLAVSENKILYVKKILVSANRLKSINFSLDLFISLSRNDDSAEEVDLNQVLKDAKRQILSETSFNGLTLTTDQLPRISGSSSQIQLLFYHLLSNAIRFRKGNVVMVKVESVIYETNLIQNIKDKYYYGEVVRLSIRDDGEGFDVDDKEYVFNMFKKIYTSGSGLGFGLTICKKIVENHMGEISVSSEKGKGTTVTVILPLKK